MLEAREAISQARKFLHDTKRMVQSELYQLEKALQQREGQLQAVCGRLPGGHQEVMERVLSHGCQMTSAYTCTVCDNYHGGW